MPLTRSGLDGLDLGALVRVAQRQRIPVAVTCNGCGLTDLVRNENDLTAWQDSHTRHQQQARAET